MKVDGSICWGFGIVVGSGFGIVAGNELDSGLGDEVGEVF